MLGDVADLFFVVEEEGCLALAESADLEFVINESLFL